MDHGSVNGVNVVVAPGELLARMSITMRAQIAPATAEQVRSQAYMAAVVLKKLARQLELATDHRRSEELDRESLHEDLQTMLVALEAPEALTVAVAAIGVVGGHASLSPVIAQLYAHREALGDQDFTRLLGRVRVALRADLDRRMEFAS